MMKWLLVLVVVGVGLWALLVRGREPRRRAAPPRAEAMVECAHCGLHLPAADAVLEGTRVYCSDAHRLAGPRRQDPR